MLLGIATPYCIAYWHKLGHGLNSRQYRRIKLYYQFLSTKSFVFTSENILKIILFKLALYVQLYISLHPSNTNTMTTLEKIKLHAAEIMACGGPKNTWERKVVEMATPKGRAGNAGKRTQKNHNKNW